MASKLPAADVVSEEGGAEAQVFGSAKGEPADDGYWTVAGRSHCSTHVEPSNRGVGRNAAPEAPRPELHLKCAFKQAPRTPATRAAGPSL